MLVDLPTLLVFVPIALALNLTPGADMMFCLGQGIHSGPRAGVAAAFGISVGSLIYALAAGLGLAALIAAHPVAFEAIRWAGVGYLIWLAISALRHPMGVLKPGEVRATTAGRAFRAAIVVNLLNPKIALFILALIPQFVRPENGSVLLQFLIFGMILNIGGTIINAAVGVFAGGIGRFLARNRIWAQVLTWATSFVFLGLAAKMALDRR